MSDEATEWVKLSLSEAIKLPWHAREVYALDNSPQELEMQVHAALRRYQRRSSVREERSQTRFSTLSVRWREEWSPGGDRVDYLDFTIDGKSLKDLLRTDNHPWLGRARPEAARGFCRAALLLAEPEFLFGRVPLYLCKMCGDPACGADTVRITRSRGSVFWSAFGHEVTYTPGYAEYYEDLGPFRFHREQYFDCLLGGLSEALARTT